MITVPEEKDFIDLNINSVEENIYIQALFFSFFEKPGLKNKTNLSTLVI